MRERGGQRRRREESARALERAEKKGAERGGARAREGAMM